MFYIILNHKYNIFNVPCVRVSQKFLFNQCFMECIQSKENPEILFDIFKNNMFMLDDYERIYYSMMYLMYLYSLKKINNQIIMNFDYHLKVKTNEWNEFIKTFRNF